jgi:hypothetical protein
MYGQNVRQKKSIVLLITLFFISAISILILQNLKDTQQFLDNISSDNSLSQLQITVENVTTEIPRFLNKNKEDIDDILKYSSVVPFKFANVDILLNIKEYKIPEYNINDLDTVEVNYQYDFLELVARNKEAYGKYTNQKQIQHTIDEYIKTTKDNEILDIKDKFTFIKDTNGSKLIKCDYTVKIDSLTCRSSLIFDLNNLSIKDFHIISIF